jgi:hypothetical protein
MIYNFIKLHLVYIRYTDIDYIQFNQIHHIQFADT